MWVFFGKPFQCIFQTISAVAETGQTVSFSVIETEVVTNTSHRNKSINSSFVKGRQAAGSTEVLVTPFYVNPNPKNCLWCVWQLVYFVYYNLSNLCMTYFYCSFLSILCMTLSMISTFSIYYKIRFILFSFKTWFLS